VRVNCMRGLNVQLQEMSVIIEKMEEESKKYGDLNVDIDLNTEHRGHHSSPCSPNNKVSHPFSPPVTTLTALGDPSCVLCACVFATFVHTFPIPSARSSLCLFIFCTPHPLAVVQQTCIKNISKLYLSAVQYITLHNDNIWNLTHFVQRVTIILSKHFI
jgi:hypothetical protein